ncbi:putative HTH-type transcriptional regulator YdfH [Hartmannibacter diazotrophicus]|uniref:Putative HTH-type transcriptional regulator YdfH n=1 Tax=Hartmannibacter diazotrophicus TaxID=1482074 RepID=A0A2C9DBW2_9HYPH|nr:GntR family transcriptional regulator [Hartmannibacter diazotrophicus]SON57095.1 putative HTH-type transcriptional regulator YdfH [Hartmannibacter diazotrophicus]
MTIERRAQAGLAARGAPVAKGKTASQPSERIQAEFGGFGGAGLRSARARTIYAALLEAILAGRLAPSMRLPEDDIGSIYGASRTIVRSALEGLSRDGVIVLEPNRGAFVASPGVVEAREVFEARLLIEPHLTHAAAGHVSKKDIALLRRHLEAEEAAVHDEQQGTAILLSGRFHVLVAGMAGQATLAGFVRELVSRSSLIVALYWRRRQATCACESHRILVDLLAEGKGEEASRLMREHLVDTLEGLDLSGPRQATASLAEALGTDLETAGAKSA